MKKNIAVVGCGHWGKNLVRNFAELGALLAVCDPNIEVAQKYANYYETNELSFSEVINDARVEGVVLAVPAPLHAPLAIAAMEAEKHVFVEKPLAMNSIEAQSMIEKAEICGVHLMVGHLLQYHPIFETLKKLKESDTFGAIHNIYSNRLSFGKFRSDEDVIWSFAPHDVSMILSLVGQDPTSVRTEAVSNIKEDVADSATIHMEFYSGLKAHISVSWLHPYKEQKLVLIGEKAMSVFDDTKPWAEKLALYRHTSSTSGAFQQLKKGEVEYLDVPQSEPLMNECAHFTHVVSGKLKPLTNGSEGLRVLNVLTAASLSQSQNKVIRLKNI